MSTPMHDMPEHLAMEVNADGQGPAGRGEAVGVACWCGKDGCTEYGVAVGGPWMATTCTRCKVTGICTPWNDYYDSPLWTEGKVCEPCLLSLAGDLSMIVEKEENP